MAKSHPKYITTAALRFLNDAKQPTHRIYGYDENGKLYMSNGNAIYVGEPIADLPPQYQADCISLLQPFVEKFENTLTSDPLPLLVDDIKAVRKQQKDADVYHPVYRIELRGDEEIWFDCGRLLRAPELLGKKNVTITLPSSPVQPAKLESQRGVIYQLPVRL